MYILRLVFRFIYLSTIFIYSTYYHKNFYFNTQDCYKINSTLYKHALDKRMIWCVWAFAVKAAKHKTSNRSNNIRRRTALWTIFFVKCPTAASRDDDDDTNKCIHTIQNRIAMERWFNNYIFKENNNNINKIIKTKTETCVVRMPTVFHLYTYLYTVFNGVYMRHKYTKLFPLLSIGHVAVFVTLAPNICNQNTSFGCFLDTFRLPSGFVDFFMAVNCCWSFLNSKHPKTKIHNIPRVHYISFQKHRIQHFKKKSFFYMHHTFLHSRIPRISMILLANMGAKRMDVCALISYAISIQNHTDVIQRAREQKKKKQFIAHGKNQITV